MAHSGLTFLSRRVLLSMSAMAFMVAACSAGDATENHDAARSDVRGLADAAESDTPGLVHDAADLDAHSPTDAEGLDAQTLDGAADLDAHSPTDAGTIPPTAPACQAGDRTEWSGLIPNTTIAVNVCSTCGMSYVAAANGGDGTGQVTVHNGSMTIMVDVPAGGTATTAQIADDPTDGTVSVCGTSGSHGCLPVSPQNQEYCNPVRAIANLRRQRIDQGVDYAGSGPIYAIGPGIINVYRNRNATGWPGLTFLSYMLSVGPAAGKDVFVAENIDLNPTLHSGSFVFSGTVLGTLVNAYPNSELGWGVPGRTYTAEHSCWVDGCSTALGINFNNLLTCLHAPSGVMNPNNCCLSSDGYPADWCTLLSQWQ